MNDELLGLNYNHLHWPWNSTSARRAHRRAPKAPVAPRPTGAS